MERQRTLSKLDGGVSTSPIFAAQSGEDLAIDELSRKMLSWSRLWFGSSGDGTASEKHDLVRERLLSWLKRCIGRQACDVLTSRGEDVAFVKSSPLLTAFLGRRAMCEISLRVLNDL